MRNVHLHGHLEKFSKDPISLEIATAAEAIRAIGCQVPGFIQALSEGSYQVVMEKPTSSIALDIEQIPDFNLGIADLHIIPVIEGAIDKGGAIKTILGVALVGAAIFFSGGVLAAPLGAGLLSGVTYGNLAMIGIALTLSGVSALYSGAKNTDAAKKADSFSIAGPGNVYEQGFPVPLVYGEVITGGVMISGGIYIENIGSYTP